MKTSFFVFYTNEKKEVELCTHQAFESHVAAGLYARAKIEKNEFSYRILSEQEVKRSVIHLDAFRKYFGFCCLELRKNDHGVTTGLRFQGIPMGIDLTKCDLSIVASMPDEPFLDNKGIAAIIKRKGNGTTDWTIAKVA